MSDKVVIRLPEQVRDGVECELLDDGTGAIAAVDVPGVGTQSIPRAWLERVPAALGVVADRNGNPWMLRGNLWYCGTCDPPPQSSYQQLDRNFGPLTPLVREPDVEWLRQQLIETARASNAGQPVDEDWCQRNAVLLLDAMRSRT